MSIFNALLPKLFDISNKPAKNFNDELQAALDVLDKFEEEYQNGRGSAKERAQKEKARMTTLQSIHEDDDDTHITDSAKPTTKPVEKPTENTKRRASKKRSKDEVEGMYSPEQDKRAKRNASVKAQTIISKQVNVNLTQKMRRDDSIQADKKSRRRKEDDKENDPVPTVTETIQIKQEKISIPPEPMDTDSLPVDIVVKQEGNKDDIAMPPPVAPVPKPRKALQKDKEKKDKEDDSGASDNEDTNTRRSRRNTKTRKQTETLPPPPAPAASSRATRASARAGSRASKMADDEAGMPPPEPRPKRTRARKKVSESSTEGVKNSTQTSIESGPASPTEKPRPKRTRRGRNADKENVQQVPAEPQTTKQKETPQLNQEEPQSVKQKDTAQEKLEDSRTTKQKETSQQKLEDSQTTKQKVTSQQISPKEERISSQPESPVLQKSKKDKKTAKSKAKKVLDSDDSVQIQNQTSHPEPETTKPLDETRVIQTNKLNMNVTVTLQNDMDSTMVLPNGVYNHAPVTPKTMQVNETMVLETHCRETMVLDKQNINDATVVLDKDAKQINITEDNDSLLTEDGSETEAATPPASLPPQPSSAVKEKVQQFEELAARTTRTKTRAMAKMQDEDTHTPPDKIMKPQAALSADTLNKMNNMIFNGKPPQASSVSASKPRAIPVPVKPQHASTSKLSSLHKLKEAADKEKEDARKKKEAILEAKRELQKNKDAKDVAEKEKEDARRKKEAMLEAKRELQKKKREEKMANAAAAREAADRERKLAMEAAAKERMEKQLHADQGKLERLKEVERKKQELARKVAETEERRRAEEAARLQRLALEQKKADAARRKQLEEAEAMKKEAALMAKEIEKKQKEYLEKQKLKQRLDDKLHTPFKTPGTPGYYPQEPVYMSDGFQHLNSDEESEPANMPVPVWSSSKARRMALVYQSEIEQSHIDKLFSVRKHSPDLREIFPNIERARLKRTSSAVWRTPPRLPPLHEGHWYVGSLAANSAALT